MNTSLNQLSETNWDLLIIGGGIVGAGVARDAAMRGLRTLLVEKADFAFGTSSRSSRFLHGGIRYLGQGKVRLVREASREKMVLSRIAPHLCEPLRFTFPTYKGGRWPLWQLGIGVKIYDWLTGAGNVGPSRKLKQNETLDVTPGLNPDGLTGCVQYYDAFTNDARLVLDNLIDAEQHGAAVKNYTRFVDATRSADGWTAELQAVETEETVSIKTKTVVNATGAWSPQVPHSRLQIRPTKGVHLVIHKDRLPVDTAVVMTEGKRILFAYPWGERTIIGTTDTDYEGSLDHPDCNETDIAYILDIANRNFPGANLVPEDVRSNWSGLRPLVWKKGSAPSDISRSHKILPGEPGWWGVGGGKLTTYRLIAEETLDKLLKNTANKAKPCKTAEQPLRAGENPENLVGTMPPEVTREWVERFMRKEWAVHLDDIMIRRTKWWYYQDEPEKTAQTVANWMAEIGNWNENRLRIEQDRLKVV